MISHAVLTFYLLAVSCAFIFVVTVFAAFKALPVFHAFSSQVIKLAAIEALLDSDFCVWLAPYLQIIDDNTIANKILLVRFFVNHHFDCHRGTFVGSNRYSLDT